MSSWLSSKEGFTNSLPPASLRVYVNYKRVALMLASMLDLGTLVVTRSYNELVVTRFNVVVTSP